MIDTERMELLEKLWTALKAWRKNSFNHTWQPVGVVIRQLEALEARLEQQGTSER